MTSEKTRGFLVHLYAARGLMRRASSSITSSGFWEALPKIVPTTPSSAWRLSTNTTP
ncbi:unnamed protein product, partial [Larinioides sclopetarius]